MYESLAVAINEARRNGGDLALRHYARTEFVAGANPRLLLRPSNGTRKAIAGRRSLRAWFRSRWADGDVAQAATLDDG